MPLSGRPGVASRTRAPDEVRRPPGSTVSIMSTFRGSIGASAALVVVVAVTATGCGGGKGKAAPQSPAPSEVSTAPVDTGGPGPALIVYSSPAELAAKISKAGL